MKNKNLWLIIGAVVIIAAIIVGVRAIQKPTQKEQVIKIGAILPLTGKLSFLGEPERDALLLASQHLKQKGVNLQVRFYDSQGDPKTAVAAMQQAITADGIKVFLASVSGVGMALKPVAESQDVFLGAIAFHPDITKEAKHTVRFLYDGRREAEVMTDLVLKEKPGSILILASRDPLSEVQVNEVIRPKLSKAGIDFHEEWFEFGAKDYRNQIARLRALSPSHLIVLGYGSDIKLLLLQMLEQKALQGLKTVGGIGFIELVGQVPYEAVENAVFVSPAFLVRGSRLFQQLSEEFESKWKRSITYDAVYAYDALHMLAEVLSNNPQATAQIVRERLMSSEFTGVTGRSSFDPMGNLQTELAVARYGRSFELLPVGAKEGQQ